MKKWFITLGCAAVMAAAVPAAPSFAQGIGIDTPVGGVRIGEPYRHHDGRFYDGRRFHERDVYLGRRGCRTVTVERDDGTVKRIRRCDF